MIQSDWFDCYGDNWKNEITPDAFAHPAKFSRALIRRIYQHVIEEGWIAAGDTVLDPFGGVALGGRDALQAGLHWVGVELEPRFVELGNRNIALWRAMAERAAAWGLNGWGSAQLIQGDSRELAAVLNGAKGAGLGVSSPPYSNTVHGNHGLNLEMFAEPGRVGKKSHAIGEREMDRYGDNPANLGNMREGSHALAVSSPPHADSHVAADDNPYVDIPGGQLGTAQTGHMVGKKSGNYGHTPGQLGAMAVSSPPYAESLASDDPDKRGGLFRDPKRRNDKTLTAEYGATPGQLGAMAVSSPPYEASVVRNEKTYDDSRLEFAKASGETAQRATWGFNKGSAGQTGYGDTPANLGNDTGTDFWSAARAIVEQLRLCLRPGAHAVWVLKGFVRDKAYVDFPMQWAEMCQACGFEPVHWHRAWLVEERVTPGLFNDYTEIKESKSFFRRLAEAKARAALLWPDLPRGYQALWLWRAHYNIWQAYRKQLEKKPDVKPPTALRILEAAQMLAWKAAGKPRLEIDTAVDFEVVLCTRLIK